MSRRFALAGAALLSVAHPAAAAVDAGEPSPRGDTVAVHRGAAAVPARDVPDQPGESWRVAQAPYEIEDLQRALNALGYDAGPADSMMGRATSNAIRTYEADHQLPITGEFSPRLLDHVRDTLAAMSPARSPDRSFGGIDEPSADTDLVANIQAELRRRGYDVPVVSGDVDAATEAAIRAYQRDQGLTVTGEPSERLLAELTGAGAPEGESVDRGLVREIQRELQDRGYDIGATDGVLGPTTRNAIRTYQADAGLPVTGEASASLLRSLQSAEGGAPRYARERERRRGAEGRVVLEDSFADGDYTQDPRWTVQSGNFAVQDGALVSRVAPAQTPAAAGGGEAPSAGDIGRNLLAGVLQQALGGGQGAAGRDGESEQATISTAAPIENAFELRLDLSSHRGGGRFAFGPYQGGGDRNTGYRLAYSSGDDPSFRLLDVSPDGVRVVATSDRTIDLEDGDVHSIDWRRSPEGRMVVAVDGEEVIATTDRGFDEAFDGLTVTNAGGEYAVHRVTVEVPEEY